MDGVRRSHERHGRRIPARRASVLVRRKQKGCGPITRSLIGGEKERALPCAHVMRTCSSRVVGDKTDAICSDVYSTNGDACSSTPIARAWTCQDGSASLSMPFVSRTCSIPARSRAKPQPPHKPAPAYPLHIYISPVVQRSRYAPSPAPLITIQARTHRCCVAQRHLVLACPLRLVRMPSAKRTAAPPQRSIACSSTKEGREEDVQLGMADEITRRADRENNNPEVSRQLLSAATEDMAINGDAMLDSHQRFRERRYFPRGKCRS